jgi:hypothetical protein
MISKYGKKWALCLSLVVIGSVAFMPCTLSTARGERVDHRDFAIDTCYPNSNEIELASNRAKKFWAKHASCYATESQYLAVETSSLSPYGGLYPKLIASETTASFFAHGKLTYSNLQLLGIMIYDTKRGRFTSNQGYVAVDTPNRGTIARFGPYLARYIGRG